MNRAISSILLVVGIVALTGCGKKDKDDKDAGAGSFPNIYSTLQLSLPRFVATSLTGPFKKDVFGPRLLAGAVPSSTTNFGSAADWAASGAASNNGIGQFLRDAGAGGTAKSLWTVLSGVQGTVEYINSDLSDENGEPKNCTALTSGQTVKAPFWSTATESIVSLSDAGNYTCYTQSATAITAFGRRAIASPAASCTDAYEYYVLQAYAESGKANTGTDTSYGATSDGGGSTRFYYHGCDKTIKVQLASHTKYSGGVEFSLRTEIDGNTATSQFHIRSAWVDMFSATNGTYSSIVGTGTTFKVGATNGTFMIGELKAVCSNTTSCPAPTGEFNYCVENTGATVSTLAAASASTTCTSNTALASKYTSTAPIVGSSATDTAGIPRTIFNVSSAALGL